MSYNINEFSSIKKLVIFGGNNVGKSSLVRRLNQGKEFNLSNINPSVESKIIINYKL